MSKTKLELTWIGKDKRPKLEPRILLEDPRLSYHAKHKVSDKDTFDNKLIFGDNLLALKALEQEYTGKVKCIYIDPPFNTGQAFDQYDDGLEHSLWLSLMRDRFEILSKLLSEDGSIWIHLDDSELHYCKVLLDEIMMRRNFVASIVWQKVFAKKNKALISGSHDSILVYAKNIEKWERNLLPRDEDQLKAFKNPDNDPRGRWQSVSYSVKSESSDKRAAYRYPIALPGGGEALPPQGRHWNGMPDRTKKLVDDDRLWFGPKGDKPPRMKVFLSEVQNGVVPDSWWKHETTGNNQEAKKEVIAAIQGEEPFSTPKPERLLKKVIEVASNPGDIILDSFSGSGTTGAVAHKMGRQWIMIELGEHCHSHIIPRLQKVIDGDDQGGVSKALNWQGGGGFRYYKLAPSLIEYDRFGQPVINKEFNAEMMAEAVCKLEGFTYSPSGSLWWQHGYSTETDFIYVTTQNLSVDQLEKISEEVGSDKTLLVMCGAFRCKADRFANLTIKKLPKAVLKHCEWAHDDYSLNVDNLPMAERDPEQENLF